MSIRFLCAIILLPNVLSSSLNCTFDAQCCWFSRHGLTPWKITNGGSTNVSSRRTFHTEKSKGSLTIRGESSQLSGNNFISVTMAPNETISAEWTSCPFCSRSGLVTIKLMAWHSPTADLQLCWRFKGNTEMQTKKCATVRRWTQFGYTISRFAVPRERRLQFYIQMVNKESRSTAIAVIDRILVETSLCNQVYPKQQLNSAAKKSSSSNAPLAHRYIKEPPKSTSPASFN
uniref:MAM domain-containing protein n=1 Tax=Parascaris univalens TaxID=6257 RepID=A0A914ZHW0_PARUN